MAHAAWLYGDEGDDVLDLGNGGGIASGGDGNDRVSGGSGRDLLIDRAGADRMHGNSGDDILIAHLTRFDDRFSADDREVAYAAIAGEWASGRAYSERIDNLNGPGSATPERFNGGYFLQTKGSADTGRTVFDDSAANAVNLPNGGSGEDWFLFNDGRDGSAADTLTGVHPGETGSDIGVS